MPTHYEKSSYSPSLSVSVIIPAYNSSPTLDLCLQALQQQTYSPIEIIVIDDGSTDDIAAIAQRYPVIFVSQPRSGQATARNRGARLAQGEILLFTDADCAPASDWIERMIAPLVDPTLAGTKGIYHTHQSELVARFVQQEYQDRYDRMARCSQIDHIDTYAAAYRRCLFWTTGGFDVTFQYNEDQEFSFRLARQGYRLVYVPEAVVYHQHKHTVWAYARRKYFIGFWKAAIGYRHPTKLVRDSHTPQLLKVQMLLALGGGFLIAASQFVNNRTILTNGLRAWGLLLLSGFQFYHKIWRRDTAVLWVAPLLIFVRATSLGLGFVTGSIWLLLGWLKPKRNCP